MSRGCDLRRGGAVIPQAGRRDMERSAIWPDTTQSLRSTGARLNRGRVLSSDDRFSSIARLKAIVNIEAPKIRALSESTYFAGLRKVGVPEK